MPPESWTGTPRHVYTCHPEYGLDMPWHIYIYIHAIRRQRVKAFSGLQQQMKDINLFLISYNSFWVLQDSVTLQWPRKQWLKWQLLSQVLVFLFFTREYHKCLFSGSKYSFQNFIVVLLIIYHRVSLLITRLFICHFQCLKIVVVYCSVISNR